MKENNQLEIMRHSCSHLLAMAVLKLFPKTKLGIGPAIENGFYYDFEFEKPIVEKDLEKIEKEMEKIKKEAITFEKKEITYEEAKKIFKNQPYKLELIEDIKKEKGNSISIYKNTSFTDLCKGPHINNTSKIGPFKLLSLAGAYWKGSEKNKMLTRIYGTCFEDKKELNNYLKVIKEAKKRDHRKIGKELDLFCFSDLVGAGLPLYTPKGTILKDELQKYVEEICQHYGFEKVMTPHLAKIELFKLSGHADKFREELFCVSSPRGHDFVMRPVLCPHQTQIYASKPRSYRDLPIRYMESEKQYRAEKTGEIGGLNRVYAITIEDGHSFCRIDQVKDEIINIVNIIKDFYGGLGLWGKHWVSFSVRDYGHLEKYIGEAKDWDECERILEEVANEMKLDAKKREGEAALYGPKLDFMFKDALGNEIQIPTVQLDFATPKRFGLNYIDQNGKKISPVIVHRAILGSYERLIALLIEYFVGAFPPWLSPIQAIIIPITDKQKDYAQKIQKQLKEEKIRVNLDDRSETVGAKIRDAEMQKIPYMIIVGEKEIKSKNISIRTRGGRIIGNMKLDKFISLLKEDIDKKRQI